MTDMIPYILTKTPAKFGGKDNWLGVKMSPHLPMEFINEVTELGVKTNKGFFYWSQCPSEVIQTIYQRLKLKEMQTEQITEDQLAAYNRMKDLTSELSDLIFEMNVDDRKHSIDYVKSQLDELK